MTTQTYKNPGYASYIRYAHGGSTSSWLFATEAEAQADLDSMVERVREQGGTLAIAEIMVSCRTCGGSGSVLSAKSHARCGGFRGHIYKTCYKRCADCA